MKKGFKYNHVTDLSYDFGGGKPKADSNSKITKSKKMDKLDEEMMSAKSFVNFPKNSKGDGDRMQDNPDLKYNVNSVFKDRGRKNQTVTDSYGNKTKNPDLPVIPKSKKAKKSKKY